MRKIKVAPSVLSADFSKLLEDVKMVENLGAELLHIDVMDGHFVPNITIGPLVVKALKGKTNLILDTHLMIENPQKFISDFADAGSDIITVHVETLNESELKEALLKIKSFGIKAGIALNPATPLTKAEHVFGNVDMVLIMSVNPGFAGQEFMPAALPKIAELKGKINKHVDIEVDGGVNDKNAKDLIEAGANILVAGSYIFKSDNIKEALRRLKECGK